LIIFDSRAAHTRRLRAAIFRLLLPLRYYAAAITREARLILMMPLLDAATPHYAFADALSADYFSAADAALMMLADAADAAMRRRRRYACHTAAMPRYGACLRRRHYATLMLTAYAAAILMLHAAYAYAFRYTFHTLYVIIFRRLIRFDFRRFFRKMLSRYVT